LSEESGPKEAIVQYALNVPRWSLEIELEQHRHSPIVGDTEHLAVDRDAPERRLIVSTSRRKNRNARFRPSMDHGAMDSSSDHSSRASPVTGSPKHPHSPSTQQGQQQQLHGSQHQPPSSHQQSHGREQIRDHQQQQQQQQHRGVPTPGSPTRGSPPQGLPLSPPPLSAGGGPGAPPGMVPRMPGLPPPGLGLLGQLGGMLSGHHGSPLELMAAHHAVLPPRSYNSPPPISTSDPTANECKLVDYRGQKVAAFIIAGDTMLCLPQAFELFLKHLVGGLHTVYTKLKRLDIVPLVCNVEQVRILRGLGAIQPGVNRCKLLSCKDFDILYRDCTTAR